MCRNAEEARIFLRNKSGFKGSSAEFPYPRLLVAIDMNQKEFIAHPHCQDVSYENCMRGFLNIFSKGIVDKFATVTDIKG